MLAVALGLRLWGIGWQLPSALYFDEMKYSEWADRALDGGPGLVTDLRNPTFYHHLLLTEYWLASLVRPRTSNPEQAVFHLYLARVTAAVLGALACVFTALAAARLAALLQTSPSPSGARSALASQRHVPPLVGLVAGLTLAVALLHVHMSHYGLNDAPASAFLAASLWFGTRALSGGRFDLVCSGLLAGLALVTKYNFGVALLLPLVIAVLVPRAARLDRDWLWHHGERIGLVVGAFIVAALAGMPELTQSPDVVLAGIAEQARLGGLRWSGQSGAPTSLLYAETLGHGLGWSVLIAAAAGAVVAWRRNSLVLAAQLAIPLGCLLVMLRQELFFARFALPLLPSLAMFAGLGLVALATLGAGLLGGKPGAGAGHPNLRFGVALGALTILALLPVTTSTFTHNRLATTQDTRVQARQWLDQHAGSSRVATESYGVPIAWSGSRGRNSSYRLQRSEAMIDPAIVSKLVCDGTRYFLVASLTAERELAEREMPPGPTGYDLLARTGKVVATFDPFYPGARAPAHPDNTGIPFWYLDAYARPGPRVTVYEVAEGAYSCVTPRR